MHGQHTWRCVVAGSVGGAQVHAAHHVHHVVVGAGAHRAGGLRMPLGGEARGKRAALSAGCMQPGTVQALPAGASGRQIPCCLPAASGGLGVHRQSCPHLVTAAALAALLLKAPGPAADTALLRLRPLVRTPLP